jgi:hypothetical protein
VCVSVCVCVGGWAGVTIKRALSTVRVHVQY